MDDEWLVSIPGSWLRLGGAAIVMCALNTHTRNASLVMSLYSDNRPTLLLIIIID